ncbi:AAA family ATPase [Candidatus Bipolaricaulota bacterium]|nr:AAA family ATPase [Candidatus Bipolaricaulota bacterium]MCK5585896.1 AAA family ATPase [Candidatus Bipolaricaulota bacterium]
MAFTIAVAGKGGTGKSTVAGLIIRALVERRTGPVLAIDADPNSNLGELLGLEVETTIGELQAETLEKIRDLPDGVPLSRHLEYELHQSIVEGEGVDLLVMGRGEGPGCYCAVNNILRRCFATLRGAYKYAVLDNEAGMEHLVRRVSHGVDLLLMVSDANPVAIRAVARIASLADELKLGVGSRYLILNRLQTAISERGAEEIERSGLEVIARVPHDEEIVTLNLDGRPLNALRSDAASLAEINRMLATVLPEEEGE